jgi:hypothetical protein
MRRFALIALISGVAGAGVGSSVSASSSAGRSRTVPCRESIDGTRFPYVGGFARRLRYRLVLDAVSAPPAYLEQKPSPTGTRPWRYFSKKGLVVRAGRKQPVFVSVPQRWRARAGIAWGYGGHGVFSSIRILGCPGPPNQGYAYSGGFYLRSPSACVPLRFQVGKRSTLLRFGVGRRCK